MEDLDFYIYIMKKKLLITLMTMGLFVLSGSAQSIELTPSYGYQLGTKLNYGQNFIRMDDGSQFGIVLGIETASDLMAEITYIRQTANLTIRDVVVSPQETYLAELNADWFQIGAINYFSDDVVQPYAGGGLGVVIYSPQNENFDILTRSLDNQTVFSFHFKGGVNIMFSEVVGLNLQAALLIPANWGGVFVGAGPGGPSGGVSISSTTVTGAFSGGLVFRFGT